MKTTTRAVVGTRFQGMSWGPEITNRNSSTRNLGEKWRVMPNEFRMVSFPNPSFTKSITKQSSRSSDVTIDRSNQEATHKCQNQNKMTVAFVDGRY